MKILNLTVLTSALLLAGCVVAPVPRGQVVVEPSVEIVYMWDPYFNRYYYVDRGARIYMAPGWVHPGNRGRGHHRGWRD